MSLQIHKETVYTLSDDQLMDANVQGASDLAVGVAITGVAYFTYKIYKAVVKT